MEEDSETSLEEDKESFCGDIYIYSDDDSHNGSSSDGKDTEDSSGSKSDHDKDGENKASCVKTRSSYKKCSLFRFLVRIIEILLVN